VLTAVVGAGIYETQRAVRLANEARTFMQQPNPLAARVEQLQRERDDATNKLARLLAENARLKSNPHELELLRLRGKITQLQNEVEKDKGATNDPDVLMTQSLLDRLKLLKQRFEQPGTTIPEMQFLTERDWLDGILYHELTNDVTIRQAMASMRSAAKSEVANGINDALKQFTKDNNGQYPTNLERLKPYLQSPMDTFLDHYEIAGPGWVSYPLPGDVQNSASVQKWALVEKGSFTRAGISIRDASNPNFIDPDYDTTIVIYPGGCFGFGY